MSTSGPKSSRKLCIALATLTAAGLLAACGSGGSAQSSDDTAKANESAIAGPASGAPVLATLVPEKIAEAGKVIVGTDTTYAPMNFLADDGKTIVGVDIDVLNAVLAQLGLTAEYVSAPFDNIIPGIASGKYDMGASSFTINAERLKVVNMTSYMTAGTQWATSAGNPKNVDPNAACGLVVAVQRGTVQVDDVSARSKKCSDAGSKAIQIDQYQGQDQATASVVSGKSDAMLADSPIVAYAVTQSGAKLQQLGPIYESAPYGWVTAKPNLALAAALAKAAEAALADGSYEAALTKWGAQDGAVDAFVVNPNLG